MKKILLAWLGTTDLNASVGDEKAGLGPIGLAITARKFDQIVLLSNHPKESVSAYEKWLHALRKVAVKIHSEELSRPNDYEEIYRAAFRVVENTIRESKEKIELTFHLSPGTPAMAAIWIILAKTRFSANLIETSVQEGIRDTKIPFEIAAEFVPDLLREPDRALQDRTAALAPPSSEFSAILHQSRQMAALLDQAQKVAMPDRSATKSSRICRGLLVRRCASRLKLMPRLNREFQTTWCVLSPRTVER